MSLQSVFVIQNVSYMYELSLSWLVFLVIRGESILSTWYYVEVSYIVSAGLLELSGKWLALSGNVCLMECLKSSEQCVKGCSR